MDRQSQNSESSSYIRRRNDNNNNSRFERQSDDYYDTFNPPLTNNRLSNRQNYERNSQISYSTYPTQEYSNNRQNYERNSQINYSAYPIQEYSNNQQSPNNNTRLRDSHYEEQRKYSNDQQSPNNNTRLRDSHYEKKPEYSNDSYKSPTRVTFDTNQDTIRRYNTTTNNSSSDQIQRSPPKVDYTVTQNPSNNPRSIVLDINITINSGNSTRNPQIITTSSTNNIPIRRSSPIRSTAIIQDVGYVDLDIRSPQRTARLSTDGLIQSSSSSKQSNDNRN